MRIRICKQPNTRLYMLLLASMFISIYFIYSSYTVQEQELIPVPKFRDEDAIIENGKTVEKKIILFWSSFFSTENWGMGGKIIGEKYFRDLNCPVTNCIFSHDRNFLNSPADYDALVFHAGESEPIEIPSKRSENQIYVMTSQESPVNTWNNFKYDYNFFNITMTYRLDSDIYFGYGQIREIETGAIVAPTEKPYWRKPETVNDPKILNLIKSKSKMAAWIVSNCKSHSRRDLLAKKLQKYIDVDIYGKCGTLKCPRSEDASEQCDKLLDSTYKFYLAFENSLCVDYLTEKIFGYIQRDIIPIVYNGADMSKFLPPHSYINVDDFESVEELANYLKYLDANPQAYADYFWWKKYYKLYQYQPGYCELCTMITHWNMEHRKQSYFDILLWFNYKTCKQPRIFV